MILKSPKLKLTRASKKARASVSHHHLSCDYSVKEIAASWQMPLEQALILISRLEAKGVLAKVPSRRVFRQDQLYSFVTK